MPLRLPAALALACVIALPARAEEGWASWYQQGRVTASGERFNPEGMTAAHRTLRFGTRVQITDLATGRSVVCRIADRGPFVRGRIIDLAKGCAVALVGRDRRGRPAKGLTRVRVARLR